MRGAGQGGAGGRVEYLCRRESLKHQLPPPTLLPFMSIWKCDSEESSMISDCSNTRTWIPLFVMLFQVVDFNGGLKRIHNIYSRYLYTDMDISIAM